MQETLLEWKESAIPHRVFISGDSGSTLVRMEVVKDVEPQQIRLQLDQSFETVLSGWKGEAAGISDAFDSAHVYNQLRVLFTLPQGSVLWGVSHIVLPDGKKMSLDSLGYVPGMAEENGKLTPIQAI